MALTTRSKLGGGLFVVLLAIGLIVGLLQLRNTHSSKTAAVAAGNDGTTTVPMAFPSESSGQSGGKCV